MWSSLKALLQLAFNDRECLHESVKCFGLRPFASEKCCATWKKTDVRAASPSVSVDAGSSRSSALRPLGENLSAKKDPRRYHGAGPTCTKKTAIYPVAGATNDAVAVSPSDRVRAGRAAYSQSAPDDAAPWLSQSSTATASSAPVARIFMTASATSGLGTA